MDHTRRTNKQATPSQASAPLPPDKKTPPAFVYQQTTQDDCDKPKITVKCFEEYGIEKTRELILNQCTGYNHLLPSKLPVKNDLLLVLNLIQLNDETAYITIYQTMKADTRNFRSLPDPDELMKITDSVKDHSEKNHILEKALTEFINSMSAIFPENDNIDLSLFFNHLPENTLYNKETVTLLLSQNKLKSTLEVIVANNPDILKEPVRQLTTLSDKSCDNPPLEPSPQVACAGPAMDPEETAESLSLLIPNKPDAKLEEDFISSFITNREKNCTDVDLLTNYLDILLNTNAELKKSIVPVDAIITNAALAQIIIRYHLAVTQDIREDIYYDRNEEILTQVLNLTKMINDDNSKRIILLLDILKKEHISNHLAEINFPQAPTFMDRMQSIFNNRQLRAHFYDRHISVIELAFAGLHKPEAGNITGDTLTFMNLQAVALKAWDRNEKPQSELKKHFPSNVGVSEYLKHIKEV